MLNKAPLEVSFLFPSSFVFAFFSSSVLIFFDFFLNECLLFFFSPFFFKAALIISAAKNSRELTALVGRQIACRQQDIIVLPPAILAPTVRQQFVQ